MPEEVILVDENDVEIGQAEKLSVHHSGALHRALSVFIFNSKGQMLLQQRAFHKYHTPGLFSNTCCSHPRPGEDTQAAAHRRLQEEMGFDCPIKALFSFQYRADFDNGLIEHELDHVFAGVFDGEPVANPDEVASWKWVNIPELRADVAANPDTYTFWFRHVLERTLEAWQEEQIKN